MDVAPPQVDNRPHSSYLFTNTSAVAGVSRVRIVDSALIKLLPRKSPGAACSEREWRKIGLRNWTVCFLRSLPQ